MNSFVFTKLSRKKFLDLPKSVRERILIKLKALRGHDDIFAILKRVYHLDPATHRLRVGNYRLILELMKQTSKESIFYVLDVGDRRDIYK